MKLKLQKPSNNDSHETKVTKSPFLKLKIEPYLDFLEVHFAVIVYQLEFMEYAIHVAFQRCIFMNLAIAKLFDSLCLDKIEK